MATELGPGPVLAVAMDGAEPTLVRSLIDAGELPTLADLERRGSWRVVTSSAEMGSASVWPTFVTGQDPLEHGMHYVWRWEPQDMRIAREHGESMVPWWRAVAERGRKVLTLDVPFLPFANVPGCVELAEWGPHDRTRTAAHSHPPELAAVIDAEVGRHPYQLDRPPPNDHITTAELAELARRSREGAELRGKAAVRLIADHAPDLALIVFTETHRASHLLWQTVDPTDALVRDRPGPDRRALIDVFRAVDAAVGEIIAGYGSPVQTMVFSLHGMRSARGVPTALDPLLKALGYAAPAPRSAGEGARRLFSAVKRGAPEPVRRLWRDLAPPDLLNAVAGVDALPSYDWSRTRAFSLPSDQHGWVRINLAGREAAGTVPPDEYLPLCAELTRTFLDLRTEGGEPLVERVIEVAREQGGTPPAQLPDLVVHWRDAAHDDPLHVAGTVSRPEGRRITGKHTLEGFLISSQPGRGERITAHELGRLLGAGPPGGA